MEFGKRHADVLRAIEKITDSTSGVSADFNERNFALVTYTDVYCKECSGQDAGVSVS